NGIKKREGKSDHFTGGKTLMLRPAHSARRELPGPDGYTGADHARQIQAYVRDLERHHDRRGRGPGAARWISGFPPYIDARGHWQPGVTLRDRPGPMTIREAREKSAERKLAERSVTR